MQIIGSIKKDLNEIKRLTDILKEEFYSRDLEILSGASIGQHVRHILEFYLCLRESETTGIVCYDKRKRDIRIETGRRFAQTVIDNIITWLEQIVSDRSLVLKGNFSLSTDEEIQLKTSLYRELAYNLEHSTHHQALIKVGVKHLSHAQILSETFGVAPSTIRNRIH